VTILISGDLHWSANPRDDYRHAFVKQLRSLITEHGADTVVLVGDFTEAKDRHDAELVNMVVGHIDRLSQLVDKLILLRGNHDSRTDPLMPFFKFLGRLPNVTWVNVPTAIGSYLFLPHTSSYKKEWAEYIENKFAGFDIVFAHNTFDGTLGDNGRKLEGVPTGIFPKGLTVISGDVHSPQRVGPVTYVGAPYQIDFGDQYQPRVLLLEDGKMTSIPCRGPQKQLVEIRSVRELRKVRGLIKDDILKVRVTIDRSQTAKWHEIREDVRAWGDDNGYRVHVVQPVIEDADRRLDISKRRKVSKTDEQLFGDYCRRMGIDDDTATVGRKILGEA
jgi:predicted phosphodiesterase